MFTPYCFPSYNLIMTFVNRTRQNFRHTPLRIKFDWLPKFQNFVFCDPFGQRPSLHKNRTSDRTSSNFPLSIPTFRGETAAVEGRGFPYKLYSMVENESDDLIRWNKVILFSLKLAFMNIFKSARGGLNEQDGVLVHRPVVVDNFNIF